MNETRALQAQLSDGRIEECSITFSTVPPWRIVVNGLGFSGEEFEASDLFETLVALRTALDRRGIKLLCAGARVDVYPSGMSRGMGGGRKAYVTTVGKPTAIADLVDIFYPALPEQVGSVLEQRAHHVQWMEFFRRGDRRS